MKKIYLTLVILATLGTASACSTVEGAGKDLQHLGSEIQETAQ